MSDFLPIAAFRSRRPALWLGLGLARLAVVCACTAIVPGAHAEDTRGPMHMPPPAALQHYNRGRDFYQDGRYHEAVAELEQALTLDPGSPNLVYNLARVYELLGDIDRALPHYEHYRDMLPATAVDERARIQGTLQRLRGAREDLQSRDEEPERQLRPPNLIARTERGVADAAFWTLASLSLAALAMGTISGGMALNAGREAHNFVLGGQGDLADRNRKADHADKLALISDLSFGLGAVGGLTSILLYALRTRTIIAPDAIEPTAAVGATGFMLGVRGSL